MDLVIGQDSLRAGCDRDNAVATFFAMVNSHCYQLLATQLGWLPADWQRWLTSTLEHEFFGTGGPASASAAPQAGSGQTRPE